MSVPQLKDAAPVDYTNRPATENARMNLLMRVPKGVAVEVDPNAPPVAQPDETGGSPTGNTGRTYGVDQWLKKKGIDPESVVSSPDPRDLPRSAIDPDKAKYERPIVAPVEDETDIDLTAGEKVFRVTMPDRTVVEIPMAETQLRNLGLVQYREQQIGKLFRKINDLDPDTEEAEAEADRLNDRLFKAQRELLILMVPSFRDFPAAVDILPLERYQRIIDTAQRYNALRLGQAKEGTPEEVEAYDAYRRRMLEARRADAAAEADPNG